MVEATNKAKGASLFILRERFRKVQHPVESLEPKEIQQADEETDEVQWFEVDRVGNVATLNTDDPSSVGAENDGMVSELCPSKPATGNRILKAQFGRRRTHNEQTLVRPCGIIYARATMFGTEAVSNFLVGPVSITNCTIDLINHCSREWLSMPFLCHLEPENLSTYSTTQIVWPDNKLRATLGLQV
jgi:hypothetical protein